MHRAEFSVFAGQPEPLRGRAGPFDRALMGGRLGQIYAEMLSEPIPEEWRRLLEGLEDGACERKREEA